VRALQLPDEAALLKAMGQGELEAAVDEHDRAIALAPPDVQGEIDAEGAELEDAQVSAHIAGGAQDAEGRANAEARGHAAVADLSRLAVADAARREWTEAHAEQAARAEAAERELRARGLAERIPVTDAEVAEASAQERETPAMDPAEAARLKAEQTARVEADRQARAEVSARLTPATDAEVARYGTGAQREAQAEADGTGWWNTYLAGVHAQMDAEARDLALRYPVTDTEMEAAAAQHEAREAAGAGQDRAEAAGEIRAELGALSAKVDQFVQQDAERAAKRAEMTQAAIDEPVVRGPQAEPALEASWQPGNAQGQYETQSESDYEAEMEL